MRTYKNLLYVSLFLVLVGAFLLNNYKVAGAVGTVTVTEKDSKSTVELNRGDILAVILEFSPGTGYSWQIAKNDANLLEPQGESNISGGTEQKSMPGAAEQATFRLKALKSGTASVEFHHKRVWEKEPFAVFSITVKIR